LGTTGASAACPGQLKITKTELEVGLRRKEQT